jgi:pantothenate kinase
VGRIEQRIARVHDVRGLTARLLTAADEQPGRFLLGITGPPGAGKSTLAHALAASVLGERGRIALVAPLDGFHLSNEALDSLGLLSLKGAPQTFDATAFVGYLRRLRDDSAARLLWPDFDRSAERTVPDAISIVASTWLVITEGNYLLLEQPPWHEVRELLDQVWYLDVPEEILRRRLIDRAMSHGRPADDAVRHVDESDLRNAELVSRTKHLADVIIR